MAACCQNLDPSCKYHSDEYAILKCQALLCSFLSRKGTLSGPWKVTGIFVDIY